MKSNFIVISFFAALSILVTWPLALHLNTYIIDKTDGLLITWILNWTIAHPFDFNANIFFPFKNTLAFSDLQWPLAFLTAPFVKISGEPLVAYNLSILLGLFLTPLSIYFFLKYLTNDHRVSFLGSLIFSFGPMRLGYLAHPQLLNFWPVVLATMFLWQKKYKFFIFFFLIASLTTPLFFFFLLAIGLIGQTRQIRQICLAALITAPFLWPYWQVSQTFHYVRPITDAIHNSLQFPDLFNLRSDGTKAFVGAAALIFIVWGIWPAPAPSGRGRGKVFLALAGISFLLALGPALHIFTNTIHLGPIPAIPLPYTIFYYLVPGFAGMRTPSRWIILAAFALIVAAAINLKGKISTRVFGLFVVLGLLGIPWGLKFYEVPKVKDFPPEQVWLRDHYQGAPIVQFPIYGWWDKDSQEPLREYYSTIHWHPMYNGFSGFSPKSWEDSIKWLQKEFPSRETIAFLKEKGIKLVIMEGVGPPALRVGEVKGLGLIQEFEDTKIYEIL